MSLLNRRKFFKLLLLESTLLSLLNFKSSSQNQKLSVESTRKMTIGAQKELRPKKSYFGSVNILEFGADPTGQTSSLAAFERAIAHSKHVLVPEGKFYLNSSLKLNQSNLSDLTIEGLSNQSIVVGRILVKANRISLINLHFNGERITQPTGKHLVEIRESRDCKIKGCSFRNLLYGLSDLNGNDGIYIRSILKEDGSDPDYLIDGISIEDCEFLDLSRHGISVIDGRNVVVRNCYFSTHRGGFDAEPNRKIEIIENILVENCSFDGKRALSAISYVDTNESSTKAHKGMGLQVNGTRTGRLVKNVNYRNCSFISCRIGIVWSGIEDSNIENCIFEETEEINFRISGQNNDAKNIFVRNFSVTGNALSSKLISVSATENLNVDNLVLSRSYGIIEIDPESKDQKRRKETKSSVKFTNCKFHSTFWGADKSFMEISPSSKVVLESCHFLHESLPKMGGRLFAFIKNENRIGLLEGLFRNLKSSPGSALIVNRCQFRILGGTLVSSVISCIPAMEEMRVSECLFRDINRSENFNPFLIHVDVTSSSDSETSFEFIKNQIQDCQTRGLVVKGVRHAKIVGNFFENSGTLLEEAIQIENVEQVILSENQLSAAF